MAWGVVRRWNPFFLSLINKLINESIDDSFRRQRKKKGKGILELTRKEEKEHIC
jgi:hypothetical protein